MTALVACKRGDLLVLRPEKAIEVARGETEELSLLIEDRREDGVLGTLLERQKEAYECILKEDKGGCLPACVHDRDERACPFDLIAGGTCSY